MRYYILFLLASFGLVFPCIIAAEQGNNYQAHLTGELEALTKLLSSAADLTGRPVRAQTSPIRLQIRSKRIQASLSIRSKIEKSWKSYFHSPLGVEEDRTDFTLFSGAAKWRGQETSLAGYVSNRNGIKTVKVSFEKPEKRKTRGKKIVRFKGRIENIDLISGTVSRRTDSLPEGARCGTKDSHLVMHSRAAIDEFPETKSAALPELEILSYSDHAWYQTFGEDSNLEVASLINEAEVIYEAQLGITFRIVAQHAFNSGAQPFLSNDAEILLDQLGQYSLDHPEHGSADVYHLFTGRNLNDGTLGIAWLGVVCDTPQLSFGVIQNDGAASNPIIFAHELGHNLGADHTGSGIMTPFIDIPPATSFSAPSINEITGYIGGLFDMCLADSTSAPDVSPTPIPSPTPTPTPTPTPSPTPTLSPSPSPTPTPTTSPFPDRSVELLTALTKNGEFSATYMLQGNTSNCDIALLSSPTKIGLQSPHQVFRKAAIFTSERVLTDNPFRVRLKPGVSKKKGKIFFRAALICGDDQTLSEISTVNPVSVVGPRRSKIKWIELLRLSFDSI